MSKNKNKTEYLRIKKLKQQANEKENNHKMDFTESPTRDNQVHIYHDDSLDFIGTLVTIMALKRMRRTSRMLSLPINKEDADDDTN